MNHEALEALLADVAAKRLSVEEARAMLIAQPFVEEGFAKVDTARAARTGVGEVIYGEGKTPAHIATIAQTLRANGQQRVLITRLQPEKVDELRAALQYADASVPFDYDEVSRLAVVGGDSSSRGEGSVVVVAAGTSDLPVAEEAARTAEFLGSRVTRRFDVGVAGLHRLLAFQDDIAQASAIIAVAGMEGALASVVAGLARCPVIAVPTSVGYGAAFEGIAALLAMLNSCSSGVSVVNIDNGFGAGYQAHLINRASKSNCLL